MTDNSVRKWKYTAIGSSVLWLVTIGPTAIDNLYLLPSKTKRLVSDISSWVVNDHFWSGKWTNEGMVGQEKVPEAFVHLKLDVGNKISGGTITSTMFPDDFPLDFILIEGHQISEYEHELRAYDFVGGKEFEFARFRAKRLIKSDELQLTTLKQSLPMFPLESVLWRDSGTSPQ